MFSLIRKLICHRIFISFFVFFSGMRGGEMSRDFYFFCFFFLFVIFMWVWGVGWSAVVEDLFGTS